MLLIYNKQQRFSWNSKNLIHESDERKKYISALQRADRNLDDITELITFAKG